ncbi:hypothetical protein GCM10017771_19610 [Streptomyces capitiformicae]|uniref:Uncharacterized protein n=1 Tax=Streptomyces capitiformicae TaxID=2014920 RepID=A0A919L7M6_9ACTN|nr:hypothetical protein GCM10017771_19610 [Streptomyces capitiformicae]
MVQRAGREGAGPPGVPGGTREYARVPDRTREYARVPDRTREYARVPDRTREYARVPDRTREYARVPDRTREYARVVTQRSGRPGRTGPPGRGTVAWPTGAHGSRRVNAQTSTRP